MDYSRFKHRVFEAALTLLSIVLAVCIGEIAARFAGFKPMRSESGLKSFILHDPVLGWRNAPNSERLLESVKFPSTLVRINSKGLRDKEHECQRQRKKKRILVLGDSMVWGWGVEAQDRFTDRLEASIPDVEVVNAGVPGYSTDQELIWLEREGLKYRPDLVILVLYFNDVIDNPLKRVHLVFSKPAFELEPSGALTLTGVPCPRPSVVGMSVVKLFASSSLFAALSRLLPSDLFAQQMQDSGMSRGLRASLSQGSSLSLTSDGHFLAETKAPAYAVQLTVALIHKMRELVRQNGSGFIVASQCCGHKSCEEVVNLLKSSSFLVCDLDKSAGFRSRRMNIPDEGHWNVAGHEFVFRSLLGPVKELMRDGRPPQE
jgi:hypothetical protein